jgi:S1-C subfamily serine protease
VVQITSARNNPNQIIIVNGVTSTGTSTALGFGFVYDNQGLIVTNYHVIDGQLKQKSLLQMETHILQVLWEKTLTQT